MIAVYRSACPSPASLLKVVLLEEWRAYFLGHPAYFLVGLFATSLSGIATKPHDRHSMRVGRPNFNSGLPSFSLLLILNEGSLEGSPESPALPVPPLPPSCIRPAYPILVLLSFRTSYDSQTMDGVGPAKFPPLFSIFPPCF